MMVSDSLIEAYRYLVPATVRRRFANYPDPDDLIGVGNMALVHGARRWEPGRQPLRSYLMSAIRWALLQHLRDSSWEPRREQQRRRRDGEGEARLRLVSLDAPLEDDGRVEELVADPGPGPELLALEEKEPGFAPALPAPRTPAGIYFSPEEDRILIIHYAAHSAAEIGMCLGRSEEGIQGRVRRLRRAGRLPREAKGRWSLADRRWLARNLGHGYDYEGAAIYLGRTPRAVRLMAGEIGPRLRAANSVGTLTMKQAGEVFGGGGWANRLREYARTGLLAASGGGKGRPWRICRGDLIQFLQEHPDRYDARLVSPEWQSYAQPSSLPPGYLTPQQAARALGVRVMVVYRRIWRGEIQACHFEGISGVDRTWWFIARGAVKP